MQRLEPIPGGPGSVDEPPPTFRTIAYDSRARGSPFPGSSRPTLDATHRTSRALLSARLCPRAFRRRPRAASLRGRIRPGRAHRHRRGSERRARLPLLAAGRGRGGRASGWRGAPRRRGRRRLPPSGRRPLLVPVRPRGRRSVPWRGVEGRAARRRARVPDSSARGGPVRATSSCGPRRMRTFPWAPDAHGLFHLRGVDLVDSGFHAFGGRGCPAPLGAIDVRLARPSDRGRRRAPLRVDRAGRERGGDRPPRSCPTRASR